MNLPVVRPSETDPFPWRGLKWTARELLQLPMRLRMALYPWLNAGCVRFLSAWLAPGMRCFEWGSGRSTVFLARRTAHVVSMEHKPKWCRRVRGRLDVLHLTNVEHVCLEPDPLTPPSPERPQVWRHLDLVDRKPEFAAYADHVLTYPDAHFDLLLIDGRNRTACCANGAAKVRPGGVLVLDNSEWPKYHDVWRILDGWEATDHSNGVWRTTIFVKPV